MRCAVFFQSIYISNVLNPLHIGDYEDNMKKYDVYSLKSRITIIIDNILFILKDIMKEYGNSTVHLKAEFNAVFHFCMYN